ncbi:MAG: hypothetical protein V3U76_17350, partial [Granulosicoccus sp.]
LLGAAGDPATAPVYCFSPYDRRLMRIEPDGAVGWQFSLPGSNQTNHIESIDYVNGGTVAIIADATPSVDDSAFDMSLFDQTGTYIGTVPVLQDIANQTGEPYPGINLDGLDLLVQRGPTYSNPDTSDSAHPWINDIYVFGEYYSEVAGGDPTQLTGWFNEGGFREKLDSRTGETLGTVLFPGESAASVMQQCPVPGSTESGSCE